MSKPGELAPGMQPAAFEAALQELREKQTVARIWQKDTSVWSEKPEHQQIIANSLGWLTVPGQVLQRVAELQSFAQEIRSAGFTHAVLVLDSTVPAAVAHLEAQVKLENTLFIVASKSGSTTEPQMFQRYFYERVKQWKGGRVGENFVAVTDPGTLLEKQAKEEGFRKTFLNWPDIGGRYSALSFFGMVPFAVMGGDVAELLARAAAAAKACQSEDVGVN